MKAYHLKVALHGVSPMIWRRLVVAENTSLAKLHYVLQSVFDWDDDHLHRFHIYGVDYGINYVGAIMYSGDVTKVPLSQFKFDAGDKFYYEYNFFEFLRVDIRLEAIVDMDEGKMIEPHCIKGSGLIGVTKYDEMDAMLHALKVIVKADKNTTVADVKPAVDAYFNTRFSVKRLNQKILDDFTELDDMEVHY